ncbi:MAG: cytochrome P450 [Gammaproteobacteria bacterium]|jgi:cytochrome P450
MDGQTFCSDRSPGAKGEIADANLGFLFNNMISSSGDRHQRLKLIGNRVFMPKFVEKYRPIVEKVVDEHIEMAPFDLVEDFSAQITVAMICAIPGIPRDEMEQIRRWTAVPGDNSGASTWLPELDQDLVEQGRQT